MSIIEKVRSALGNMGANLGIVSAAARKAAEQERIKTHLMAKHGVGVGEILWSSALKLSQEQEMTLQEAADLVEERKLVLDKFSDQIQETWRMISSTVQKAWDNLRELLQEDQVSERQKQIQRSSYRKSKSQRKNWSKWKKRKR